MIDAVSDVGKYALSADRKSVDDVVDILVEDPASSDSYKHILTINLDKKGKEFKFSGVGLEDYSKKKIKKYLYRRGSSGGPDITPTSRVMETSKTFERKILRGVKQTKNDKALTFTDGEREFITALENCLDENEGVILSQLKKKSEGIKEKENSIITIVINDGGKKYIGDFSIFRKILEMKGLVGFYRKYGTESRSENKICSVCKTQKREVYGFVNTYNFYTVDKPGFVSGGFDQSLAWKNYPVCHDCALILEYGKKYLDEFSRFRFYGFSYYAVPKLLGPNQNNDVYEILEEFKGKDPKFKDEYIRLMDEKEEEILELLSQQNNFLNYNFLIYKEEKSAFKILLYIEDIFPSRLKELFKAKKELDEIKIFKECMVPIYENKKKIGEKSLAFNFGNIWYFFRDKSKYFLEISNKIFTDKKIDYSFLLKEINCRIKKDFDNSKFLHSTRLSTLKGFQLLLFLQKLSLLKNYNGGCHMTETENNKNDIFEKDKDNNLSERVKTANDLFKTFPDFFNVPIKRAIFLEGVLTQLLLDIQFQDREAFPFRSKLHGLRLDAKIVKHLLPEIQNKLNEYDKNFYKDLEQETSKYMVQSGDKWDITKGEIAYYFVLGMNLAYLFKTNLESENSE